MKMSCLKASALRGVWLQGIEVVRLKVQRSAELAIEYQNKIFRYFGDKFAAKKRVIHFCTRQRRCRRSRDGPDGG